MPNPFPANPLMVMITAAQTGVWWHVLHTGPGRMQMWDVSADVGLDRCVPRYRHVGDLAIVQVDLRHQLTRLDPVALGEWPLGFVDDAVIDPSEGRLQPDLDAMLGDGPPRMLVVRDITLTPRWRGYGLGGMLLASALHMLSTSARFAACKVPADTDYRPSDGSGSRSRRARQSGLETMLGRIGFRQWQGVHVVGLHEPTLTQAGTAALERWWDHQSTLRPEPQRAEEDPAPEPSGGE